ncbi:hypothetical protein BJ980_001513 [Nocardioides daedukensis]|uniref:LppM domain-containing protein n=1 Tax=Nocardioides daedukensis TaxID=634462 RepID=A0A7Y9UVR6_9ACTN|nr:hypothetical protein [Nocardioides daedukensis]NYG58590.1 hypothetical protein [Nocardioides daedukensis]
MLRRIASVLAVLGLLMLLTGCLKVEMELKIGSDGTVSGTMITAMNKDAITTMGPISGASGDDPRAVWEAMQEDSYDDLPEGATVEPYEEGDFIGDRITFDAVPVEEVGGVLDSGESGAFTITHQYDTYVFKGSFDLSGQAGAGGVSDAEMKGFFAVYGKPEMKVSLTFPGEVTETNGEVDGTNVTWTRDLTATTQEPMTAIAKDSGGAVGPNGGGGADGGTDGDGTDEDESASAADDSQAMVLAGTGAGALVVLLALIGLAMGVNRALRG